jgi:glycosyltransferase involved in cell wall biosynthesis
MEKIKLVNFSIAYTKYLSKLSKEISNKEIHVEHLWCKSMEYWEPTEIREEMFKEIKMNSVSIPIKNDKHGKYYETISFEFFWYLIKSNPDILIIDSNLISSFFYLILAKFLKTKIISFTTNFPDTATVWGKISDKILKLHDVFIDQYVVPSTRKKNDMIKIGINSNKISNIGHGVDIELFFKKNKEIEGIPQDKKIILCIGRFTIKKGKKYLIESFQNIKSQVENAFLIIIGDGPEKENLINLIKERKMQDDILLMDKVNNSSMPEYYSISEVIVIPTIEPEPFGPIYLESMAASKPIVAFDVGGGEKDLIQNQINGILVKTRDVKEMANAIVELLNDDDKRKSMGAISRKIIQENYTYEILAGKWRGIVRQLVSMN